MPIEFRPAAINGTGLFVSIAGGSRSGKTVSALRMARGIAGPDGKVFAIDTEGRRMSHHAKAFKFDVFNMGAPYSPELFADAAEAAQAAGGACMITDSFSLEWNGIGGVTDIFEQEFDKRRRAEQHRNLCWAIAKAPHKNMRNRLMALTMPIIFCSRCNEVPKHLGGGWKAEQDQRWLYEWTVALTLHSDAPGMPCYTMNDSKGQPLHKVPDELRPLFPPGRFIGEAAGEGLQAWRSGRAVKLRDEEQPKDDKQRDAVGRLIMRIRGAETREELQLITQDPPTMQYRQRLAAGRPELEADIAAAIRDAGDRLMPRDDEGAAPADGAAETDGFPGKVTPRAAA